MKKVKSQDLTFYSSEETYKFRTLGELKMIIIATEAAQTMDWGRIILEFIVALAAVFTCTGFWELMKAKFQAKREDKKEGKININVKYDNSLISVVL